MYDIGSSCSWMNPEARQVPALQFHSQRPKQYHPKWGTVLAGKGIGQAQSDLGDSKKT
jgi:hypothetical protein